ncbi:DUF1571 domain-containing protein [Roseimaritima sediminicola]|uniref:DUF1571 domain-containing protein n=1 Tax=Roseimaritima sediminicola TaxID=2662066 RepID=UPI00129827C6|nr:DUF1571 domain-containing protein [Roseimaritima sediminicola]
MDMKRRSFVMTLGAAAAGAATASAQQPASREPVFRVSRANSIPQDRVHPLDRALQIARDGLNNIRSNVRDYSAVVVKRETINGTLTEPEFMFVKIRNRKVVDGRLRTPFGVYLMYLKPSSVKGREVVYVEGKNEGKLIAHEGGMKGRFLPTVSLSPTGALAMRGQRYPVTEIGVENLIVKLIERGETARQYPQITCEFRKNAKLKDRACTVIQLTQPEPVSELEFNQAQIFIDDELNIPIRYVAYDWPKQPGARPGVIEEYNYLDVKLNIGLSDSDFDHNNSAYNF